MKTSTGYSSCGTLVFDADTGEVYPGYTNLDADFGEIPIRVDLEEWIHRYPGEDIADGNDILDLGLWFADGRYEPPCESWRIERDEMIKAEAEYERAHK